MKSSSSRRRLRLRDLLVVAPNLHWRYSGVTSTVIALTPVQSSRIAIAAMGSHLPAHVPKIGAHQLLLDGWRRPQDHSHRIWHARRNDEMIVGIILRSVLRQPWKLVFTTAARRRHTAFTRWLMRRMDRVIATSPGAALAIDRPAAVIPHGVDTNRYRPAPSREEAWRDSGLPGAFGVGCFGRVRAQKGTDLFVEAMIALLPKFPDATAVVVGLATPDQKAFEDALRQRVAAAGLTERLRFLGELPSEDVPTWFRAVSIYVAPMRSEGFGLTVPEAMASGAAVVAARAGSAPDLLADGRTGILVPPDDLGALIQSIETLLADPGRVETLGRAARADALAMYDIAAEADAIVDVYEELLGFGERRAKTGAQTQVRARLMAPIDGV